MKKKLLKTIAFFCLIFIGIWHEYVSIQISSVGYYKGTVIDKTTAGTGGSTHYLYVDWDGFGQHSIVVHPVTYKRIGVGERFETEYSYFPIVGALGTAYAPNTGEYGIMMALAGLLSKLIALAIAVSVIHAERENVMCKFFKVKSSKS